MSWSASPPKGSVTAARQRELRKSMSSSDPPPRSPTIPSGMMDAGDDAEGGEFGLALAGDHIDFDAANLLGLADKVRTIHGVATRRRGDNPQAAHAHRVAQRAEAPQRRQRPIDRVTREHAGRLDLAPKPREHLLVEDRRGTPGQTFIGDEADRVRSDVDDGDRRAVIETALGIAVPWFDCG